MNRQEFLRILRETLQSRLTPQETEQHVEYYRTYIEEEIREGKTEMEILDVPGDPRLIARTILDTTVSSGNTQQQDYYEESRTEACEGEHTKVPDTAKRILYLCVGIAITFAVLFFIVRLVIFLLPVALAAGAVFLVISYLKKR